MTQGEIGPYRIERTLGRGGFGVVYAATHRESGARVALKTVRGARRLQLESLRREVRALARVRHPGVVDMQGDGVHDGLPWYAMELLEGLTLRGWIESCAPGAAAAQEPRGTSAPTVALDRALTSVGGGTLAQPMVRGLEGGDRLRALALLRRVSETLAYLHGEGIVHRDLKPENIFVRADQSAVLVDFGLTIEHGAQLTRESIDGSPGSAGTIAYMAPEQIDGDVVDARADIYALGCVLYEVVAGRPPFAGSTPAAVLWQHRSAAHVRLSEMASEVAPELDALVERMLVKDPFDRLGHAGVVARTLAELGAGDPPRPLPQPRTYVYRPRLAGRDREIDDLRARLDGVREAGGRLVIVTGEAGVGKTRLSTELARHAAMRDLAVYSCAARAEARLPFSTIDRLLIGISDLCREGGRAVSDATLGADGPLLAPYEPSLGSLPGQESYPAPVELPAAAARLRVCEALARVLAGLCARGPVLLLIDDLQWADELTVDFLAYLVVTAQMEQMALLVVATCRRAEMPAQVARLERLLATAVVSLERLRQDDIAPIVGDMLALRPVPEGLAALLAERSEGNPLFVAEYVRAAVAAGILARDVAGRWRLTTALLELPSAAVSLPLPGSLEDLIGQRLDALSPGARRLAGEVAVLGREIDGWLLQAAIGAEVDGAALRELMVRQILEEAVPGGVRFAHDTLREVAYRRLPDEDRQSAHRRTAALLESHPCSELHLAELARHAEGAGDEARAAVCFLAAARSAAARYATQEAERLYRAAMRLFPADAAEGRRASLELARDILFPGGRPVEAMDLARRVLAGARSASDRLLEAETLRAMCVALCRSDVVEAERLLQQALHIATELDEQELRAGCVDDLGSLAFLKGEMDRSATLRADAVAIFRRLGDTTQVALGLAGIAHAHLRAGRPARAAECLEEAERLLEGSPSKAAWTQVMATLAVAAAEGGEPRKARELYERTLAVLPAIGHRAFEAVVLGNYANHLHETGEVAAARQAMERAVAAHRRTGNRKSLGIALSNLAVMAIDASDCDAAHALLDEALALHREVGDARSEAISLRHRGVVQGRQGRLFEAIATLEGALPQLAESDRRVESSVHCELGWMNERLDRWDAARRAYERAAELGRESGDIRLEGDAVKALASVARRAGDTERAANLAARALELLERAGHVISLALGLCERGRLAVAMGEDAGPYLERARALRDGLGAQVPGTLRDDVADLEATIARASPPQP